MKMVILDKGKDIMLKGTQKMDDLKKEIDEFLTEISQQNNQLESKRDQPNKLFVASISMKKELEKSQQRLDLLKKKNTVTQYTFQRDQILGNILKERKVIGVLAEEPEIDSDLRQTITGKETYGHEIQHTTLENRSNVLRDDKLVEYDDRSKQTRTTNKQTTETRKTDEKKMPVLQQMCQPLIQRQRFCKNLNTDGQILSYAGSEQGCVGLYISNEELCKGKNLEIEILGLGMNGSIAIGVVPRDYRENILPGSGYASLGYHSDGKVLCEGVTLREDQTSWERGDHIGCEITDNKRFLGWSISFTHNGIEIYHGSVLGEHFAVGVKSEGDIVKVII